jgi:hypothetical protein
MNRIALPRTCPQLAPIRLGHQPRYAVSAKKVRDALWDYALRVMPDTMYSQKKVHDSTT